MNGLQKKIHAGEEILFSTRVHWSRFLLPLSLALLGIFYVWMIIPAILLMSYHLFIFYSHQFVVTNSRLIEKRGFYYIRINEWPFQKIDDVIFIQSLGDRLWDSGSIILMGTAIPKTKLTTIWHPKQLRDAIYSQLPATNGR